jgi:ribosome-associated protein
MLNVNEKISIRLTEFNFSYARSPGPGGQNVNKVNSKVILKWSLEKTKALPESVRHRFTQKFAKRISHDGVLVITSHRFRDQGRNVADCLGKLREMILSVAEEPKRRKKTKVPRGVKLRRLENKRKKSLTKQTRRKPRLDD